MSSPKSSALGLTPSVMVKLRAQLPAVGGQTVAAVIAEVPGYASGFGGPQGGRIEEAVEMALGGFLNIASRSEGSDPGSPLKPALDGAYVLGRDEARSGRSMDALLAAYRVGARVAWRELADVAVSAGLPAETMVRFAELVFAYIDELSAASVSGHAEELATADRVRRRHLDRLARGLLSGDPADTLQAAADRAGWRPPETLTVVLMPGAHIRGIWSLVDSRTLLLAEDLPGLESDDEGVILLVPEVIGDARERLRRSLSGRSALIGPTRPWAMARESYDRALRGLSIGLSTSSGDAVDTEAHLAELVIGSDRQALADLRAQVLAPLAEVRPSTAEKLTETLRAWVLNQGRRDQIAASLFIHPQTVRYRMGQLRELYGDRLDDPDAVLAASIALGVPSATSTGGAPR